MACFISEGKQFADKLYRREHGIILNNFQVVSHLTRYAVLLYFKRAFSN